MKVVYISFPSSADLSGLAVGGPAKVTSGSLTLDGTVAAIADIQDPPVPPEIAEIREKLDTHKHPVVGETGPAVS